MSLEQALAANTEALNRVAALLQAQAVSVPQTAAVVQQQQPQVTQQPQFAQQTAQTGMPAAPFGGAGQVNQQPQFAQQPAAPTVPFSDANGVMQYTMAAYQQLGAAKGQNIQAILGQLGHQNLNDLRADQYGQFFAMVEQLKAAP